ncbi:MAG: DNA polymerase III subunit gamma/tau [Anaerolineales bacterium]|nr:DNA polymerase III subunit gamma/tau [Anaerolineales bacterium]
MAAQALYRKWRPQTFDEMVGQGHVTHTLQNALPAGRISHAYLFTGPRGTGKTSMGRLLAKAVNCLSTDDNKPCNQCRICQAINEGRLLDLIEVDAASNRGIDEVRGIREKVGFRPNEARYKVYILDEAHMLTEPAFNALLKTLEEPPPHVIFVLVTTEPHKIPSTILSRCQRFDFRRIPLQDIIGLLKHIADQEGLAVEPAALELIARSATGSMRDAESLLDQLISYGGEEITLAQVQSVLGTVASQAVGELVDQLLARDVAKGLDVINRVVGDGVDPRQFNRQVVEYLRELLLIKVGDDSSLVHVTPEVLQEMKGQATQLSIRELIKVVRLFNQAGLDLKASVQSQLPLELAFVDATLGEEEKEGKAAPPAARPSPGTVPKTSAGPRAASAPRSAPTGESAEAVKEKPRTEPRAASTGLRLTLDAVNSQWGRILGEAKLRNRSVEALLKSCQPLGVEGQEVVLGFLYPFHKEKIEESQNKALVESVVSQVVNSSCRIRCVLSPKGERQTQPVREPVKRPQKDTVENEETPRDKYSSIAEDPLVQEAVSKYGAQVVDVQ